MQIEITSNRASFKISDQIMTMHRHGQAQIRIDLAPVVEGRKTNILEWSQEPDGRCVGKLSEGGSVVLQVREGHLAYWMETDIDAFEDLVYFPDTTFSGDTWHTFLSDSFDGECDKRLDREVPISSAYDDILSVDGHDGGGMTDPGDIPPTFMWNMPVRACALKTGENWFAMTIPSNDIIAKTIMKA